MAAQSSDSPRFVVRLKGGLSGEQGGAKSEDTALKVFRYANPADFLAEVSPIELDVLFSFSCPNLLAGRSISRLEGDALAKLTRISGAGGGPKGSTSPKRSPQRSSLGHRGGQALTLGVEIQVAEADVKSLVGDATIPNQKVLELIVDIAKGVIALHENCRAHLDIKPSNCLYAGGRAMLSDFGACAIIQDHTRLEVRRSPTTRIYAAPEAIGAAVVGGVIEDPIPAEGLRRYGRVGYPNDMWSLGATIYELATGVEFFRFLPLPEMEKMLAYDDLDAGSPPEEPAAWVNWFITRSSAEFKEVRIRTRSGAAVSVIPGRDANVQFFFSVLTGALNGATRLAERVWDQEAAFSLAGVLGGLLELDVTARMTAAQLAETPLMAGRRPACKLLPPLVDKDANLKPARDIIRALLRRLREPESDAANMTTRVFSAFVDLLTRATSVDPGLAAEDPGHLALAAEVVAAYLTAVPFDDPAENFPNLAFAWWRGKQPAASSPAGDSAKGAAGLAIRLIASLKGRLFSPFIYERAASLREMAYLFPAIFLENVHAEPLDEILQGFRAAPPGGEGDFELDSSGADPKSVLLADFIELVVRPERAAIERLYKDKLGVDDLGSWLPEDE